MWSGSGSGIVEAEFGYCFVEVVDGLVVVVVVVVVVDELVAVVVDGNPDWHYC